MRYVSFETKDGLPKFGAMVGETHICDLSDGDWLDLSDVAEDMAWDALAATWYGFQTLWLNRQGLPFETLGAQPHHIANNLNDVKTLFSAP